MSERFAEQEQLLCEHFATAGRGPKRNGLFAVWIVLRVAGDALPPHFVTERSHKRRADALLKRLTTLTLPHPLRTPLQEAAKELGNRSPETVARVLQGLAPTVRESLGDHAANAVMTAAEAASNL